MTNDSNNESRPSKPQGNKREQTGSAPRSRRVFNAKNWESPKTTWIALLAVATVASVVGSAVLLTAPRSNGGSFFRPNNPNAVPEFAFVDAVARPTGSVPTALAAGWGNEFFLADESGVGLYDGAGKRLDFWPNPEKTPAPTALYFVADETSAKNGVLLIGYPRRIDALAFGLDRFVADATSANGSDDADDSNGANGADNSNAADGSGGDARSQDGNASADGRTDDEDKDAKPVARTAASGARGTATTILSIPGAQIAGIVATPERLFVADAASERIRRYSWSAIDALKSAEEKTIPPDCELGAPDVALAFPGLRPATPPTFAISRSAASNEIFVANSGLFRVDAFNADSGAWVLERSWAKAPGTDRAFGGAANPIGIAVGDGWVATAETGKLDEKSGKKSPLQLFDVAGSWLAEIKRGAPDAGGESNGTRAASPLALVASQDGSRLTVLDANGDVEFYDARR